MAYNGVLEKGLVLGLFLSTGGGGATRPLPRDGGVEELHGVPTVWPRPRSGPEIKNEVVPKMSRRRGTDAGQSRRRRVSSCRGYPQALQEEFSFCFFLHR